MLNKLFGGESEQLPAIIGYDSLPDYSIIKNASVICPGGNIIVLTEGIFDSSGLERNVLIEFGEDIYFQTTVLVKGEAVSLNSLITSRMISSNFFIDRSIKIIKTGKEV